MEALRTNTLGVANIIRCIQEHNIPVETVIGISTDKACLPNCAYGISKAMMEKLMIAANNDCHGTRFVLMRSGNLLASRGSVLPFFKEQIQKGKDITITDKRMTRLFITLDQMVDAVLETHRSAKPGEIFVPKMPSCRILDIAKTMIGKKEIKINYIGMRPGERLSEPIISQEELVHTYSSGEYYIIHPMLLGAFTKIPTQDRTTEYSSDMVTLSGEGLKVLLEREGLIP
jgi:UDP-glucose 4-epimerase